MLNKIKSTFNIWLLGCWVAGLLGCRSAASQADIRASVRPTRSAQAARRRQDNRAAVLSWIKLFDHSGVQQVPAV